MAIDIESIRAQQRELNMVSDEVTAVKRRLLQYKDSLDEAWRSHEVRGVDNAIEEVVRRLSRLSRDLEELGHDVMAAGEEIREEEEAARRAAEEEARRKAEEEEREAKEAAEREAQKTQTNANRSGGKWWWL